MHPSTCHCMSYAALRGNRAGNWAGLGRLLVAMSATVPGGDAAGTGFTARRRVIGGRPRQGLLTCVVAAAPNPAPI